jgi:hypothetical protein
VGPGFESRDVTLIERSALGLAVAAAGFVVLFVACAALVGAGLGLPVALRIAAVVSLLLIALLRASWEGRAEATLVRANRQGLWIGGEFFPPAALDGARLLKRGTRVLVRITARDRFLPVDLGVHDVHRGERLLRALGLDGAKGAEIEVGADGILAKSPPPRRYVHYGSIERASSGDALHPDQIELSLRGGESLVLPCPKNRAAATVQQIEKAMAACAGAESPSEPPFLRRGDRAFAGWIAELRGLGLGARMAHRVAPVLPDRLWRIVESPAARPALRAAAAVALGPRLDARDRDRLRAAAAATTAPRLRVALDAAAASAGDAEMEALLAEVEHEEAPRRSA